MKTVNNNFNCSKDSKNQRKAWDINTSKIIKVSQNKKDIKSFSPNQPIRKSTIENNQNRIQ